MKLYEVLVLVGVIFQTQNDLVRFLSGWVRCFVAAPGLQFRLQMVTVLQYVISDF